MKTKWFFLLLVFLFAANSLIAQTRGTIIQPATPAINPMNPNGDNVIVGPLVPTYPNFSNDGYYVDEFEFKMFGLPKVGNGDVAGDNQTGPNCGVTDLIPDILPLGHPEYDKRGYSVFAHKDASNNLIFRFRIGTDANSIESWHILLDADGLFGAGKDLDALADNPGFELDITLIKKQNPGVFVTNINGTDGCPNPLEFYPLASNFQISIADLVTCGDPDYFYDFYVPISGIAGALGISEAQAANTLFRYVATTSSSATCAMSGSSSDIGGIDNDDPLYDNNDLAAYTAVIEAQCPTALVSLCQDCAGFNTGVGIRPFINPISVGDLTVSGTSAGAYVKVLVYENLTVTPDSTWQDTPRDSTIVQVTGGIWSVTLVSGPLKNLDKVVAQSQLSIDGSSVCDSFSSNSSTSTTVAQNIRPVADDQNLTTPEGIALPITLTATDANPADILTYSVVTGPLHGTLSCNNCQNPIYTPNPNYFGPDSFTFKANDGKADSNIATISITVTQVNDVPIANDQAVSTDEDTPILITLTATDVDADPLTYTIVSQPLHGTLSGTGASITYTPAANYNGPDSFTFKVNDGTGDSNTATVSITVNPVNDVPVAADQSVILLEDTTAPITLVGTDVDGNSLVYSVVSGPTHGILTGSGANLTYAPNANYNGPDSFTFKVNDGTVDSNIATVTITVTPVNDAPVATSQNLTTPEETALAVTLSASDVDFGAVLTYTIVTPPTNGTLSVVSGAGVTYTPNANFVGSDSFTFKANDATVDSNIATIFIDVTPVNDVPVANSQSVILDEDTSAPITLTGSDIDGDALAYLIVAGPLHGSLTGTGANLVYTPAANYNGPDSFTFKVNDGTIDSNIATVTITVNPVNDIPVANNQTLTTPEETALPITLSATDVDTGTIFTFTIVSPPSNGTLSAVAGAGVTYTPNVNFVGSDSFTFKANDGTVDSNVATILINVTPVNDVPVANAQTVTLDEDTTTPITLTGSDPDGDALTYLIVAGPLHGTLTGTGANLVYTPSANYNGPDSFTFKVNDGTVDSNVATVTITVNPINDAPVANDQNITTPEDVAVAIVLGPATDVDGTTLTYTVVSGPLHGVLSGTGANLTYTPDLNYDGPDSFTFKASDGVLESVVATVSITVTPVNDAPVADDKNVILDEDTSIAITLTGSDPDGDGLTFTIVTAPAHGTLSGTLPNITYTPAADYFGPDSFTYKVNDGTTDSNIATVSITVTPVNDPPIALNQTVTYLFNTPVNITLTAIDVDDLQTDLVFTVLTLPANGTLTGSGTSYQFTPNSGFNGSTSFTFQVNDGTDNSNIATVTINLNDGVNYAPISENQTVTVIEDQNKNILLGASDANGDPLTYSIVSNPLHGTVVLSGQTVLYTPDPDYVGPDSFTFKSNDGTVDSNIATVTINVTPVNDAPVAINQNIIVVEDGSVVITLTGSDVDNASLTFTVLTQPTHGTLTGSGATWTYTPDANFNGPDNFTFKASDGLLDSNTGTISITVTPVNDLPVADAQTITTPEDTQIGINLEADDIDGDALTYSIITPPAHGTLSCNNCQNPVYTPALNYNGPDSFTFKANDGTGDSNVATVSITVTPVNDAPVANNQVVTVQEDIAEIITLTGSDVENSTLTYTVLTQPTHGTLTGSGNTLTYTPDLDYIGPDGFTFKVNDGSLDSNTGTVTINVVPLNDPPVAVNNTTITTNEDVAVTFSVIGNDTDVDGFVDGSTVDLDPSTPAEDKTFTVAGQGVYTVDNSGNVTFTPALNYNGLASAINYTVKDNNGALSNVAQIQVNVLPVNDIPVADNQVVTVVEDTAKDITLTGSDVEGSALTFTVLTQPTHGTLTGTGAVWTYTPNADYTGPDSFTFKVNDGSLDSNPGTVSINVVPVNDPPVAVNDVITTPEDIAVTFNIITNSDSDLDGTINPASVDLNPSTPAEDKTFTVDGQGTYTVDNLGNVTFTPVLNYNGTATPVSYTVKDNLGAVSNTATIQVIVTPVNDAPVVTPITVILNEDVPTVICFTVTDVENDPSVFTGGVSLGGNGTIVPNPTAGPFCFTYTPDPDYNGPDEVQVIVCDANDPTVCSPGIITIDVLPVNDPPRIIREGISVDKVTYSTPEDTPLTFCFDVVDPDGDTYNVSNIVNVSGGGTMVLGTGGVNELCFTFTPAPDFNGKTTWSVTICDEATPALCATFTVEVDVTPVNDAPVAENQIVTVIEDTPKTITLVGTDVDEDVLTYTIVRAPEHGTLSGTGANVIYTPDQNYVGNDTITFKVNDGTVDSNIATVVITVTPVNDAPIITPIPVLTTLEDTELKICLGVSDVEGNTITYQTPVNVSGGGTMTFVDGNCYIFKPAQDFNGDSFWKLKVCDNGDPSLCTEITVQITVTPVNDAPVAIDTEIDVMSGVKDTVDISDSYSDVDNDALVVVSIVEGPENGSATLSPEGILIYQSDLGYIGTDTIRYQVCDTAVPAACTIGVIIINVGPAPFKIYNGLSPNGDNRNDYWRIDGIEAFPNNRVLVFDRYNNLIFQTSGYNNDDNSWRGQANNSKSLISGDLPEGTYFYSVDLGDGSGLYSGYIVLKKE